MLGSTPQDYGWFTPPDLELLFSAIAKLPDPGAVVLVGGQALSFWVDLFDIPIPKLDVPYLTQDADFIGTHRDAELLARELGADIRLAGIDDNTPNLAVLTYQGVNGQKLLIDILSVIVGLSDKEVRKRALLVEIGERRLHILHPMLCLKSRIENLMTLPGKRNGNGISQARVAVEVVRVYIHYLLASHTEKDAINAVKQIREMALSRAGLYVYREYGIDLLAAVNPTLFTLQAFKEKDWPNIQHWVAKKRARQARRSTG